MSLELVQVMDQSPGHCTLCGSTPTQDGVPRPAIHAVGVDVNWGDDVYVCAECTEVICDLWDRPSAEQVLKVQSEIKFLRKQVKRKDAKIAQQDEQLDRIRKGAAAVKQVRAKKKASR